MGETGRAFKPCGRCKVSGSGGVLIAAPSSGAGKTTITLGLLRALADRGVDVQPAKSGPDYIDPTFHTLAARRESVNLDPWAMRPETLAHLSSIDGPLIAEGAMGLFDGTANGEGACADLAHGLDLSVILVVDCAKVGASVAATIRGFATHRADVPIAGVILNRLASEKHETLVRGAVEPVCTEFGIELLGALPRAGDLTIPSRHLGLVPAGEIGAIEETIHRAAELCAANCNLDAIVRLTQRETAGVSASASAPPPGQRIAIARDAAFVFCYPHLLRSWRASGATAEFFSPLADEAPPFDADAIFLPGGYPELHAHMLAGAHSFQRRMRDAADRGVPIYGECGGYMVLGETLTDSSGEVHQMLGLLGLRTSFQERRLHLGYREVHGLDGTSSFPFERRYRAHEFHHATIVHEEGDPLFHARDVIGTDLGTVGLRSGTVCGSFMHIVDAW